MSRNTVKKTCPIPPSVYVQLHVHIFLNVEIRYIFKMLGELRSALFDPQWNANEKEIRGLRKEM